MRSAFRGLVWLVRAHVGRWRNRQCRLYGHRPEYIDEGPGKVGTFRCHRCGKWL